MALELSLVIRGKDDGARKVIDETAQGIESLGEKARTATQPTKDVAEGVGKIATEAPAAATAIDDIGTAVDDVKIKFGAWQAAALGAVGGIAVALGGAVLQAAIGSAVDAIGGYFDEVTNSATNVKADLEAHKELIASIKGLWDQANGVASNYGMTTQAGLQFEARSNVRRLDEDFQSAVVRLPQSDTFFTGGSGAAFGAEARAPFAAAIEKLRRDLKDGRADVIAFREEVATIANALPQDSRAVSFAEQVLGDTADAAKLQAELQRAVDLYKALTGDADAAATAMGKAAGNMTLNGTAAETALPALREYAQLLATIGGVTVTLPDGSTASGSPGEVGGGFAEGGYTGHRPTDQVAGFVHGQEYVFDAAATARIGVANLEAIRTGVAGYASGGSVGLSTSSAGGGFSGLSSDIFSLRDALRQFGQELWNTRNPIQAFASVLSSISQNYLSKALGAAGDAMMTAFGFASGTDNHPGGWSYMNEIGPELVRLPRGSTVVPAGETRALLGAGGGETHNWYVSTPSPRQFAESRSSVARAAAGIVSLSRRHV